MGLSDRLIRMLTDSVLSITSANNLIVIKTLSGSANVAGGGAGQPATGPRCWGRWPETTPF